MFVVIRILRHVNTYWLSSLSSVAIGFRLTLEDLGAEWKQAQVKRRVTDGRVALECAHDSAQQKADE